LEWFGPQLKVRKKFFDQYYFFLGVFLGAWWVVKTTGSGIMAVGSLFTPSEEKEDVLVEENEPVTNEEPVNPTEVELELKNAKRHGQEERKFF
jgi:hypothetical protein